MASLLMAGKTPICPVQTEHIFWFGVSVSWLGQEQNNLVFVFNLTCVSNPITNSKSWAFKAASNCSKSIILYLLRS